MEKQEVRVTGFVKKVAFKIREYQGLPVTNLYALVLLHLERDLLDEASESSPLLLPAAEATGTSQSQAKMQQVFSPSQVLLISIFYFDSANTGAMSW